MITKISRIRLLHISHKAPFLPPLPPPQKKKFWITLVFHFSWVLQPFQEKLKTMLMQNLGVDGADNVHYGRCASGEWTDYQIFLGMGFREAHAWSSAIASETNVNFISFQLNTTVESRQKRYRASQQLGRSDSLDKLQVKKMASDILNWTMEEMQLLMHGVFQVCSAFSSCIISRSSCSGALHDLTTVFCELSVPRSKQSLEFSIAWGRLKTLKDRSTRVQFSEVV